MSADPADPWRDPAFEQSVRDTAYFLWESEGRVEGREQDFWFRALEVELRRRNADRALAEPSTLDEHSRPPPHQT